MISHLFGMHHSGRVDLWSDDVTMHINRTRHDHSAGQIEFRRVARNWIRTFNNRAIQNPNVFYFPVDSIARVIDSSATKQGIRQNSTPFRLAVFLQRKPNCADIPSRIQPNYRGFFLEILVVSISASDSDVKRSSRLNCVSSCSRISSNFE